MPTMQQQPLQDEPKDDPQDARWCQGAEGRYGEYGVIGAEQADETHYDQRENNDNDEDDDDEEEDEAVGADGRIKFSNKKLYGRDTEVAACLEMYKAMLVNEKKGVHSIFLSGYSGSGKSAVVQEFMRQLSNSNSSSIQKPLFLTGKYEALRNPPPFAALRELFDGIDPTVAQELRQEHMQMQESLGDDARMLLKVFPSLKSLLMLGGSSLGSSDDGKGGGGDASSISESQRSFSTMATTSYGGKKLDKKRLLFVLQFFFQSLCTQQRPVILFLDDLQWADDPSLVFLQELLASDQNKISHLLVVAAFRSNEVDDKHGVTGILKSVLPKEEENEKQEQEHHAKLLELSELSMDHVGEFLADSLRLSKKEVQPVTKAVYGKTLGNPFFVRQAVEQLVRKNVLYYDTISFCWSWSASLNSNDLQDQLSSDLVEMVKSKIQHLPPPIQKALTVAACTKATFDASTVAALLNPQQSTADLLPLLHQAMEEGLLMIPPKASKNLSSDQDADQEFSFAHDKIQEAAYSFVQPDELQRLADALYQRAQSATVGEDWMYFAAAQHWNGLSSSSSLDLARLNRTTAELSMDLLAFSAALEYCTIGLDHLKGVSGSEDKMWAEHYELALALNSMAAEAELGSGNSDQADPYCQAVLKHKKTTIDAIPVYKVHMDILSVNGKKQEVFDLSLFILEELGISFPKGERMQKVRAWTTLKQIKAKYIPTEEAIASLPHASDQLSIDTMEFLQKAGSNAFSATKIPLYVLICCESVRGLTKYGLTDSSATALSSFANILMHVYGDFDTSARLAELAILVANRLKNKFSETRALNTANNNVLGWVRPLRTRLKYHIRAQESGTVSGNVEGATVGKWFSYWVRFYGGMPLAPLEADMRVDIANMRKMGLNFYANIASVVWQIVLNLLGRSENTTKLVGEAMDENSPVYSKMPFKMIYAAWRCYAYVLFGDFEVGAKDALERGDSYTTTAIGMMYGMETFNRGMSLYAQARKGDSKCKAAAQKVRKQLKDWVQKGCVNLEGPTLLLSAELAALTKKKAKALSLFEQAIDTCTKGEFIQFVGLSRERYGLYLKEQGSIQAASEQISKAIECYRRWGAAKKVELLQNELATSYNGAETARAGR